MSGNNISLEESRRIEYRPNIHYDTPPVNVETSPYVNSSVLPSETERTYTTRESLEMIIIAVRDLLRRLIDMSGEITHNGDSLACQIAGISETITYKDYLDAAMTTTPTLKQTYIIKVFQEYASSIKGSAQDESFVELVDEYADLCLVKKFYDNLNAQVIPGDAGSVEEYVQGLDSLIKTSRQVLASNTPSTAGEIDDAEMLRMQVEAEIQNNRLNIINNIRNAIASRTMNAQYMYSDANMLMLNEPDDYFMTDGIDEELFELLSPLLGPTFVSSVNRMLTVLRINYERDKNTVLAMRQAYIDTNPKNKLQEYLDNIALNSKISIEMCDNILYNYNSREQNHSGYLSSILYSELANIQQDVVSNLEQFYYYLNGSHKQRTELMSAINAKNKKRLLYLVVDDLAKKAMNISSSSVLKDEIAASLTKINGGS